MRKCQLLQSVYTVESLPGRTRGDIDKIYKGLSTAEITKESSYFCEEQDELKRALNGGEFDSAIKKNLEKRREFAEKSCACSNRKDPLSCLKGLQSTFPPEEVCFVQTVATSYKLVRQNDGSWKGQVDKEDGRDNSCGTSAVIELTIDSVHGKNAGYMGLSWAPQNIHAESSDTATCKVLKARRVLKPFRPGEVAVGCKKVIHKPGA